MRISERQTRLLQALRAAFRDETFATRHVHKRAAGLALKEPVNAALLEAMQGCFGSKQHPMRTGALFRKIVGKRLGDLELVADGEMKRGGRYDYFVRDHSQPPLPMPAAPPSTVGPWGVELQQVAELTGKELTVLPEDVDRLMTAREGVASNRYRRDLERAQRRKERADQEAQRKRDREAIARDPEKTAIFNSWKCGRDGKPEPVEGLPAPKAAPVVEQPAPSKPESDGRPIWMREGRTATRQEWADWQRRRGATHQQHEGPAHSEHGIDWFVAACEARNREGFTS